MKGDFIKIRGARVHNLKNIKVDIPKNKMVVITGISGSGKSSLAFDTLYAEGQRRYVESLSAYARQFLGIMKKPNVFVCQSWKTSLSKMRQTNHSPDHRSDCRADFEVAQRKRNYHFGARNPGKKRRTPGNFRRNSERRICQGED